MLPPSTTNSFSNICTTDFHSENAITLASFHFLLLFGSLINIVVFIRMFVKVIPHGLTIWAKTTFAVHIWSNTHTFCFCVIMEICGRHICMALPTMVVHIGDKLDAVKNTFSFVGVL